MPPFPTLSAWLSWLEGLHPSEIDLGLERIGQVAEHMALSSVPVPVITVAGTNGKGSCVAVLEQLLLKHGYRVGAYTSPHLIDYNERVRIDGKMVADDDLCQAFAAIESARQNIPLTYFEFGTLAAMWLFQQLQVDFCVLEVGLGGRLDATNLWDADVAIVTSVALDHQDWLGDDLSVIAGEKAGIVKPKSSLLLASPQLATLIPVEHLKRAQNCVLVGRDYHYQELDISHWRWSDNDGRQLTLPQLPLPLPSVAVAVAALDVLAIPRCDEAVQQALQAVSLPGRCQSFVVDGVPVMLDVGHNPAAAGYLAEKVAQLSIAGCVHAVVGMLSDKDHQNTLRPLLTEVQHWHFCSIKQTPRGLCADQLGDSLPALKAGVVTTAHPSVTDGLQSALALAGKDDFILVFGSFFSVGEALSLLNSL